MDYDDEKQATVIYLRRVNKKVKHYLPDDDAEACMAGKQCVAWSVEIAQPRDDYMTAGLSYQKDTLGIPEYGRGLFNGECNGSTRSFFFFMLDRNWKPVPTVPLK